MQSSPCWPAVECDYEAISAGVEPSNRWRRPRACHSSWGSTRIALASRTGRGVRQGTDHVGTALDLLVQLEFRNHDPACSSEVCGTTCGNARAAGERPRYQEAR
jgi:hypothetical protein